MIDLRKCCDRK